MSLTAGRRAAWVGLAWALIWLSQPGLGRPEGFGHLAFSALIPWAWAASRPGRGAFLVEWLVGGIGLAAFTLWLRHVFAPVLPAIALVTGLYPALAGVALRRLARAFPLAFAAPAAWMIGELPRWLLEAPFSFGWWRLGTMAHDTEWLAGSARVWGTFGLSWVFAAFAGLVADLLLGRSRRRSVWWLGLGPIVLAVLLSLVTAPPEAAARETWPRVLLVQPGIEQARKVRAEEPLRDLFGNACSLTLEGLDELRAAGEPLPDLVAWGETMLYVPTAGEGLVEAVRSGARPPPWTDRDLGPQEALWLAAAEHAFVDGLIFGDPLARERIPPDALRVMAAPWLERVLAGERLVPRGTSFFSGAEHSILHQGQVRRMNAAHLWNGEGGRQGPAGKVHLVPGAEDVKGTQRLPWFLDAIREAGGYVPDFVPAERAAVLDLSSRAGERYRVGVSICYDNAFDDPYTEPLRHGELDFHLVASNEAWYRKDVEMDHMLAFSRLIAIGTGRAIVRATNSGISTVIDAAGRDHALLAVKGERKLVRGTLYTDVPVPARDGLGRAPRTWFVRSEQVQRWLWGLLLLAALVRALGRGYPPGATR